MNVRRSIGVTAVCLFGACSTEPPPVPAPPTPALAVEARAERAEPPPAPAPPTPALAVEARAERAEPPATDGEAVPYLVLLQPTPTVAPPRTYLRALDPMLSRARSLDSEAHVLRSVGIIAFRATAEQAAELARVSPGEVAFVVPDMKLRLRATKDPLSGECRPWHLAQLLPQRLNHADGREVTGRGVLVGVIDTGVLADSHAFRDSYRGRSATSHDRYWKDVSGTGCTEPCAYNDEQRDTVESHGTKMLGAILGAPCQLEGGSPQRVALSPGAEWIACKLWMGRQATLGQLVSCIEWMTDGSAERPDVINISGDIDAADDPQFHVAYEGVMTRIADLLEDSGVMLVASAGSPRGGVKCSTIDGVPARMPEVMTAGGYELRGDKPTVIEESAFGPIDQLLKPDFSLPGNCVLTTALAENPSDGVCTWGTGTSVAAAELTGIVVLLLERFPCLKGRPDRLRDLLARAAAGVEDRTCCCEADLPCCGTDPASTLPNPIYGHGVPYPLAAAALGLKENLCLGEEPLH